MMTRRSLLMVAGGSLLVIREIAVGAHPPVQLLLIREAKQPISCGSVRYIPGQLYGVPSNMALDKVASPLGLTAITRVEELPYLDNASNVSSIPPGTYEAVVRTDATKNWMTTANRRWRLELKGTNPRSNIQFHYGLDYKWSEGCIIITGDAPAGLLCKSPKTTSEEAVERLRKYVEENSNTSQPVKVKIIFS